MNALLPTDSFEGFTLIEMVIVITIMSLIMLTAIPAVSQIFMSYITSTRMVKYDRDGFVAMSRISKELIPASAFTLNSANDISITSIGKEIRFWLDAGNEILYRSEDGGADQILSRNISDLTFTTDGNYITILLKINEVGLDLRTTVYPRNLP
ncbi:MAG: prepilin-type N-terminal cleavage/methylation domain-containing protein [Magnetococcus sp. DMHC-6]